MVDTKELRALNLGISYAISILTIDMAVINAYERGSRLHDKFKGHIGGITPHRSKGEFSRINVISPKIYPEKVVNVTQVILREITPGYRLRSSTSN